MFCFTIIFLDESSNLKAGCKKDVVHDAFDAIYVSCIDNCSRYFLCNFFHLRPVMVDILSALYLRNQRYFVRTPCTNGGGWGHVLRTRLAFRTGIYRKSAVELLETGLYLNLAVVSLYDFKADKTKQTAVAYSSTVITFIHLVGVIIYHVPLVVKRGQPPDEVEEFLLTPVQSINEVTRSVVRHPRHRSPQPEPQEEVNINEIVVREISASPDEFVCTP